jgi:MoaA/NifB/PqqE/SkfB family radical SAM enzyme
MCSREHLRIGDLSSSSVPKIIKLSEKARELILFGYGEPLLSSAFHVLCKQCRSGRISFTTNGILLTRKMVERIISESNRPIFNITFSIDAACAVTYSSIRKNHQFETVWKNLRNISDYKSECNLYHPEIWINFVAMKRNIEELPELVDKAAKSGVAKINVFHMNVWKEDYIEESLMFYPELTREIFNETEAKARERGISIDIPVEIKQGVVTDGTRVHDTKIPKCYQPWSYCYVRNDSIVQACCYSERHIMGDLSKQSFEEIWNDKPYRILRSRVNRNPSSDCLRCEFRFRYTPSPNDSETYIKLRPRTI